MYRDRFGNIVTTDDPTTVEAVDRFIDCFLGYREGADVVLAAAEADPGCALVRSYAAMLHMLMENPAGMAIGRPLAIEAAKLSARASEREQAFCWAVASWAEGRWLRTIELHRQIAESHPTDLVALKLGHYHLFNQGNFPGMVRLAQPSLDALPEAPYLRGMAAFAYEQCHLLDRAEREARRAMEIEPTDAWAHHALAHVMDTQGRLLEARAFLMGRTADWEGCNSFMLTHNWWHLALAELDLERGGTALDLYDRRVWGVWKEYSQDQVGAVALLARLELRGVEVGDRWAELGPYLKPRAGDVVQPFLSLHYLYGLTRAGLTEADILAGAIEARGETVHTSLRPAWREVAAPMARGLVAGARGDWERAAKQMTRAMPRLRLIGGSHAQRDLFHQLYEAVLVRAGWLVDAQQKLEERRHANGAVGHTWRLLASVYKGLGLGREAAAAAAEADRLARVYAARPGPA